MQLTYSSDVSVRCINIFSYSQSAHSSVDHLWIMFDICLWSGIHINDINKESVILL